ncbi:hypothetical protein [Thermococcus sp.]
MRIKNIESFGILSFFTYTVFGVIFYFLIRLMLGEYSEMFDGVVGGTLFTTASGLALGIVIVPGLVRETAYARKGFGFVLGILLPVVSGRFSDTNFLIPLGIGFLLGLMTVFKPTGQLKLAKGLGVLPLLVIILPFLSELLWMAKNGTLSSETDKAIAYGKIIATVLIADIIIHRTFSHAAKAEESTEESVIFVGPTMSGKTVLSIGLFYKIVQKGIGGLEVREDSLVLGDEPIGLEDLYIFFRNSGFNGIKGTQRGWLSIQYFSIIRPFLDKFLYGLKDISLEITDYAGEDIRKIARMIEKKTEYKELIKTLRETLRDETFLKEGIVSPPKIKSEEAHMKYAHKVIDSIIKDLENYSFDFRDYSDIIKWEKVPQAARADLATAYTYGKLMRAERLVFIIDGAKLLYELYTRSPDIIGNLEFLKKNNPYYYGQISEIIRGYEAFSEAGEALSSREKALMIERTLEGDIKAYTRIATEFRKRKGNKNFVFLVTKADLIAALFDPENVIHTRTRGLKKRILRILRRSTLFKNLLRELKIPEKELEDRLKISMIVSAADLKEMDIAAAFREEIKTAGLDELVDWIRKLPRSKILSEVVKP